MQINIFDANSHVRRFIEVDRTGLPLRTLAMEVNMSPAVSVYVWDGAGGNQRRRDIFPPYKANRTPPAEDIFATMNLFKQVLRHTKAIQITVPKYEADDVIAYLVAAYQAQADITIHSTDRDLYALCALPNVRHSAVPVEKVPPHLIRLFKATKGDPSDNIPGIKGFGDKAWETCDKDEMLGWYLLGAGQLSSPDVTAERFRISKASAAWLCDNTKLALDMWKIIGFFPPTATEVNAGTTIGSVNQAEVNTLLGRFLQ